nr:E3 ubiquitin-protein ligase MARCH11 [Vulpes vulpes]
MMLGGSAQGKLGNMAIQQHRGSQPNSSPEALPTDWDTLISSLWRDRMGACKCVETQKAIQQHRGSQPNSSPEALPTDWDTLISSLWRDRMGACKCVETQKVVQGRIRRNSDFSVIKCLPSSVVTLFQQQTSTISPCTMFTFILLISAFISYELELYRHPSSSLQSSYGELLNPCRCDGSVRYTHQLCLLKWISERGSWTCELCCYRYHVIAIKMKQPCQWQSISITLVEKVQMIAVILGSLFLIASVTWLLWSAFSPYAVWQRKDILFQICYGMYGFMDLVCIGLIVHEGAAVYRVFKRWRAVNLHWDVLNYDKATDIEESSRGESSTSRTLWLPLTALRNRNLVHPTQLTSPRFQCGYVLLHLFNRMRPREDLSEDNSSGEVVMRVTSV